MGVGGGLRWHRGAVSPSDPKRPSAVAWFCHSSPRFPPSESHPLSQEKGVERGNVPRSIGLEGARAVMRGLEGNFAPPGRPKAESRAHSPDPDPGQQLCLDPAQLCAYCPIPTQLHLLPRTPNPHGCAQQPEAVLPRSQLTAASRAGGFWQGNYNSTTVGSMGAAPGATKAPPAQRCSWGARGFQPTLPPCPPWECIPRVEPWEFHAFLCNPAVTPGAGRGMSQFPARGPIPLQAENCHSAPGSNRRRSERR